VARIPPRGCAPLQLAIEALQIARAASLSIFHVLT
jgi:hypothetical protein